MIMETRTYRCRDCGYLLNTEEPINKCPQCGSLYLVPKELWQVHEPEKQKLTFFHRLILLVLGSFLSLVTIFVLSTYASLMLAADFGFSIIGSIKLAIFISISIGIFGFFAGDTKLINLLSILWGTSESPAGEGNEDFEDMLNEALIVIPPYILYTILVGSIAVIYGYIVVEIIYS